MFSGAAAELEETVRAYVNYYGWTDMTNEEIVQEVLADAYAGIDIFLGRDYYEGATKFTEAVRNAVQQRVGEQQQTRGPPESAKKSERRSDRPERRRALQRGEMVNEFHDKVNWPAYYQKIQSAQYNPDHYEAGETAYMRLDGKTLKLEMQNNGEWSVVDIREVYDGRII